MSHTREIHDNYYRPVQFNQFHSLSALFTDKAKKDFGTEELNIEVTAYSRYKVRPNLWDYNDLESFEVYKKHVEGNNTIQKANNISDITKEVFDRAATVTVSIRPKEKIEDRPSAWAQITFKDQNPKRTSFYIQ